VIDGATIASLRLLECRRGGGGGGGSGRRCRRRRRRRRRRGRGRRRRPYTVPSTRWCRHWRRCERRIEDSRSSDVVAFCHRDRRRRRVSCRRVSAPEEDSGGAAVTFPRRDVAGVRTPCIHTYTHIYIHTRVRVGCAGSRG